MNLLSLQQYVYNSFNTEGYYTGNTAHTHSVHYHMRLEHINISKLLLDNALEQGCYGITLHTGHIKDHMTCDGNDAILHHHR